MNDRTIFVAYPSNPKQLGQTLQEAAGRINTRPEISIELWEQLDIPGRFIVDGVLSKIDSSDFIIADITPVSSNGTESWEVPNKGSDVSELNVRFCPTESAHSVEI